MEGEEKKKVRKGKGEPRSLKSLRESKGGRVEGKERHASHNERKERENKGRKDSFPLGEMIKKTKKGGKGGHHSSFLS